MKSWECPCGYVYSSKKGDPENGVKPGTAFDELPGEWVCPVCSFFKEDFQLKEQD